jgi:zinc finger protein
MLLTRIPHFREIIVMSFACPHCGFANAEIQSAGEIRARGVRQELRLLDADDWSRQVVKADSCTVRFVELDLEVPAGRGRLTNVEGLLANVVEDLELHQEARREQLPEVHAKVAVVIERCRAMLGGRAFPFRLLLEDPAGSSWIEPRPKDGAGRLQRSEYARTAAQNEALGLGPVEGPALDASRDDDDDIVPNEVYAFPTSCPACNKACTTNMKMVEIPHFSQVIVMSTACDHCGYRTSEVKTGGAVPALGRCITLSVRSPVDLARDILKSESCALECPELELHVTPGTMGGRFTTVEGLLTQVRSDLSEQIVHGGDGDDGRGKAWTDFFARIDQAIAGSLPFTLVLRDPMGASYVQSLSSPAPDAQIATVEYERSREEMEDLGLLDMKTEGYGDATETTAGASAETVTDETVAEANAEAETNAEAKETKAGQK